MVVRSAVISCFYFMAGIIYYTHAEIILDKEHRTKAAEEKANENDLWCYSCAYLQPNEQCIFLTDNHSSLMEKCEDKKRICLVNHVSYTTNIGSNGTSIKKMWSLERKCTDECEPGCIIIGERTKLYSCTSCCTTSLCNIDNGVNFVVFNFYPFFHFALLWLTVWNIS